jgi:chromate transporter
VGIGEIARVFLKIGAMSYGGPAIMGIMQAEIQEKRNWIDEKAFVDGLAIVNMLPGPRATQLGIFIGHAKAGLMGGFIGGLCFILPAFLIMLALAVVYAACGNLPSLRSAFYGIGPVVLGIFAVAVYRLGKNAIRDRTQLALAIAAAVAMFLPYMGFATILLIAGCIGVLVFDSRRHGAIALTVVGVGIAAALMIDAVYVATLAVSLAQIAPHAAPDWVTWLLLLATIAALLRKNMGVLPAMLSGAAIGVLLKEGVPGKVRDLMH